MDNNSFFSLDRLLEFGLSMSIAQQMLGTMNTTMQGMHIPGSISTMPTATTSSSIFYVAMEGRQVGPLSQCELLGMINNQSINKDTLAWMPGMPNWQPIESVPEILKLIALCPPKL